MPRQSPPGASRTSGGVRLETAKPAKAEPNQVAFAIPKREVWEAFKRVKANQGAAGVDGQSIVEFEANLSGNLYKLWNRLSFRDLMSTLPGLNRIRV